MSQTSYGSIMITDTTDGVNSALIYLYKESNPYVVVTNPTGNPQNQSWYEKNGNNYERTQDTTVVSGKTYYEYIIPQVPQVPLRYNLTTGRFVTNIPDGWSINRPTNSENIVWYIVTIALSPTDEDIIDTDDWSVPSQIASTGQDGQPGINQATVFIYKRSNSDIIDAPNNSTYTFATGEFDIPSGWETSIPASNGYPCYVTSAVAIGREATQTLNWVEPVKLVEDGAPGNTYYTHILYANSNNPQQQSDTSTNPAGMSYIAIVTNTNESMPSWNSDVWNGKWVKFVGSDGATGPAGAAGRSLTNTVTQYTIATNEANITTSNMGQYTWYSNVPNYNNSTPVYWIRVTNTFANPTGTQYILYKDNGLTDSNYNAALAKSIAQSSEENAMGALSIARGVRQHFFWFPTDVSNDVPAGSYVAEEAEDDFKAGPTKGNLLTRADGIWIRKGVNTLATLQGDALTFFVLNENSQETPGIQLSNSSLDFYRPGTTTIDATLDSSGLVFTHGGVEAGIKNTTDYIYIYSHDDATNHTLTINNHEASNWRIIAGKQFGVDKAGNLYASNAYIKGKIEATTGSISNSVTIGTTTASTLLTNVNAGDNLLKDAKNSRTISITTEDENYTSWYEETTIGKDITVGNTTDTFFLSYDWVATNQTVGDLYPQIYSTSTYIVSNIVFATGTSGGSSPHIVLSSSNTSGHVEIVFKLHTTQAAREEQKIRLRCYNCTTTGGSVTISNVVFTRGGAANAGAKFLTHISATDGVRVHSAGDTTDFVQINSTDISIWRNSKKKMALNDSNLIFYDGTGTEDSDKYAEFGSTIKIYKPTTGTAAVTINSSGATFDGKIQATSGFIGQNASNGFTIANTAIYNPSTKSTLNSDTVDGIYLGKDGIALGKGLFKVSNTGALTAKSGTIGGWSIGSTSISKASTMTSGTASTQYQTLLNAPTVSENTYAMYVRHRSYDGSAYGNWTNNFLIRYDGYVYARNADIKGKITATSGSFDSVSATNFTFTSGNIAGAVKIGGSSGTAASTVVSNASTAKSKSDCITIIDTSGIWLTPTGSKPTNTSTGAGATGTRINSDGMQIYNKGILVASYGDTAIVGKQSEGHVILDDAEVKICWDDDVLAHIGYSDTYNAQYYTFGSRKSNSVIGLTSFAEGINVTSSSWATHAEGRYTTASGYDAHAEGNSTTASGYASHAGGTGTIAKGACQTAIGSYNVAQGSPSGMDVENDLAFIIGNGDSDARSNALTVSWKGDVNIASGAVYKVNNTVVASVREKKTITPTASGVSNYSSYGNSYYEKAGNVVHVHIGVKGVTANTVTAIATLPSGYRPTSQVFGHGTGGTSDNIGYMDISTAGVIQVRSATGYVSADITYLV